ncbi:MAG TPA: SH3 domain-containing protein, partial [Candidatus Binatia bacterium]|nr:SH3 domain-containing protein [Candidatus Binatia bacterium]
AETIDEIADDLHLDGSGSELRMTQLPRASYAMPRIDADAKEARRADKFADELSEAPLHMSASGSRSSQRAVGTDLGSLWLLAKRLQKKSWAELSAVVASLVLVIFGGMYLARPGSDTVSPPTDNIKSIQEGLGPISRELYRVLGRGASWETPVKQTRRSYTDLEGREAYAHLGEAKTGTDRGKPGDSGPPINGSPRRDGSPMTETNRARLEHRNPQPPRPGLSSSGFAVVGNSYVREKPASKAEVIATLRPGTRIQVVGRTGEYFRVRSLDHEAIRGYVHKEDAFFEPYH